MSSPQYPTLGRDADNSGFVGNVGNPGVSNLPPAHHDSGDPAIAGAVAVALEIGKSPGVPPLARPRLDWKTSRPITVPGSYQALAVPPTYCFLVFPQVTPNKIWEVMRIGVTAPDPFTTVPTVLMLAFRSSTIPQDSSTEPPTFGDLLAVLGSVPNTYYPATRSVIARGNERIVLAFKGLAANQQLQASMDVVEHDLQAYLLSLQHL